MLFTFGERKWDMKERSDILPSNFVSFRGKVEDLGNFTSDLHINNFLKFGTNAFIIML